MTDVNSIISPDGHLLVTINGTTIDMGSVTHPVTAGDSYLGNIAASIKALMDYNASNGGSNGSVSNSSIALYVSTAGDTQTALDARYASLAQGVLATNAVPKTTTINGKALSGNISITASDLTSGSLNGGNAASAAVSIKTRSDTTANWISANPILASGELVYLPDSGYLFIGDGVSSFTTISGKLSNAFASYSTMQNYVTSQSFATKSVTISAGTGLTGGGDLTANRSFAVSYGTAAGTAAQGNDSRIVNAVPNTRTINAKPLSANITLAASDVGALTQTAADARYATTAQGTLATNAVPNTRTVNGKPLSANISLAASDVGAATAAQGTLATNAVPNTRTVNGKSLSANISLTADDVGATTLAATDAKYVPQSSLVPVSIPSVAFHTDALPSTIMSYAKVTLGGTPLAGSLQVFVAGLLIWPPNYSLSGTTLTLNGLKTGQQVIIQYAYDQGLGAGPAVVTETTIVDSFNRTNSTTTIGNTDTGQPWIVPLNAAGTQPVWGISSNQLYCVTTQNDAYAYVDAGTPDCTVTVKIAAGSGSFGLMVRASDASNGYVANLAGLFQRKAGVTSNSTGWYVPWEPDAAPGDTVQIVCSGASISCYIQYGSTGSFILQGTGTDTDFRTNTLHGVRNSTAGTTARFDDFKISANS